MTGTLDPALKDTREAGTTDWLDWPRLAAVPCRWVCGRTWPGSKHSLAERLIEVETWAELLAGD